MANNPYDRFDADTEQVPVTAEPLPEVDADRGEPVTKSPRKRSRWKIVLLIALLVGSVLGVVIFVTLFYRNVVSKPDDPYAKVKPDAALQAEQNTGPDLGAYQEQVRKEMAKRDAERLRQEQLERDRRNPPPAQGGQAQPGQPSLGRYSNQTPAAGTTSDGQPPPPTPEEIAAKRKWDNDVMADLSDATGGPGQQYAARSGQSLERFNNQTGQSQGGRQANPSFEERMASNPYLGGGQAGGGGGSAGGLGGGGSQSNSLGGMLATESYPAGTAAIRPDTKYLLIHGTSIPCTMVPRIVTNYPGMTRCMINKDVYSADQSVVLVKAGSFANGERKVSMKQGIAKVFVAWRDIETPDGVTVRLDSLAADQLGASGVDAWIDNHYPERFGGAILLSLFDDGMKALANSTQRNNGGVTFDSSTQNGQDMASIALENSINMEPTGYVNQGKETTIIVARDVDFRSVYGVQ